MSLHGLMCQTVESSTVSGLVDVTKVALPEDKDTISEQT